MTEPICSPGSFVNGRISTELPLAQIAAAIMAGQIFILKGVFAAERADLMSLRRAVFAWAQTTAPAEQPDPQANTHCLQAGVSKLQKTPHVYHSYNFNRISQLPSAL